MRNGTRVAAGRVKSDSVDGAVEVSVGGEPGDVRLVVAHPTASGVHGLAAFERSFRHEVIRLLQEAGKLDAAKRYKLLPGRIVDQRREQAVFVGLYEDVTKSFALRHAGAR